MADALKEPYKPIEKILIAEVPAEINVPKEESVIADLAMKIESSSLEKESVLPDEFQNLEKVFNDVYQDVYNTGRWIDFKPVEHDYLFQQYAIKMDEKLDRNGFNTFGLYAVSYLEGLQKGNGKEKYMGFDNIQNGLLLGCSSITTARQFNQFMKCINPESNSIVTDINSLGVQLSRRAMKNNKTESVINSDAQRIPLKDGSIDFMATNFLVQNLIDLEGSDKNTLLEVMKEVKRIMSPNGRFVMIEQLSTNDLEWLSFYAHKAGLNFVTGGPDGGILKRASLLPKHSDFSYFTLNMNEFISENNISEDGEVDRVFELNPKEFFGSKDHYGVANLILEHSRFK